MPIYIDFMKALGANPLSLPFNELYTALEQKAVDGGTNPLDNVVFLKFYEVQKYLSISQHMYTVQSILVSSMVWDKLNAKEREVIQAAAFEARDYQRKVSRANDEKSIEFLKTRMQINVIPDVEREKMRAVADVVKEKWSKEVDTALYSQMVEQLKQLRAKK